MKKILELTDQRVKSLEKIAESSRNLRDENIKTSEETADKISEAISDHEERGQKIE